MKKLKRLCKILLVVTLVLVGFSIYPSETVLLAAPSDSEFENNEDYYYELCSNRGLSDEDKETCVLFRDYINRKREDLEDSMKDLENNIKDIKANIKNEGVKLAGYTNQIDKLEKQITSIENSIVKIEENIVVLNEQIAEREAKIETLNNQIKASMVVTQEGNRTNSYVRFIMGATSFVDLLRRISAINELTSYSEKKIEEMEKEKELLNIDLENLQQQKDYLVDQQAALEANKATLKKLVALTQELIDEFARQEADLEAEWEGLGEDFSELDNALKDIDKALASFSSSKGFGQFVKNVRFKISNSGWYYTGGGWHGAMDVARLGFTTPVYPIANGYVFAAKAGCPANGGYAGNTCNWGRGNHVCLIVDVNGKYYSVYYYHLSEVDVKVGDVVYKGETVLGLTGNSGNSTGPHLHIAIFYQGKTSEITIQQIINRYKTYGSRFGAPNNYNGTCEARNGKAPCFMDPSQIYGYYYPNWYYVGN